MSTPYTHKMTRTPKIRIAATQTAAEALGKLEKGGSQFGFTKGQFSFQDLIRAVLAQTGPAHVTISTWTAGAADVGDIGNLLTKGEILSLRLLIDRSFPTRQPKYVEQVIEVFGKDSIFLTNTHAKFCLIRNKEWTIVIRTSMNLNKNRRFEQFDLDDSPELFAFMESHVGELVGLVGPGFDVSGAKVESAFKGALGDIETEEELTQWQLDNPGRLFNMDAFINDALAR